ncbi:MAG TPA: hypothetical protein VKX30_04215 [Flavobacteriaceae bacterium]|nr:hypothetical protein [Flavobacteriaceae bacterium]
MKKVILALFAVSVLVISCKKDDDNKDESLKPRDRGEEAIAAQNQIEEYLTNYAYNYEDFESPVEGFDYRVVIDSILPGSDKIPLIEQVEYKMVEDPYEPEVKYKLYYLKVAQGEGKPVDGAEAAHITYEVWNLETNELLEQTNSSEPKAFVIDNKSTNAGLKEALKEFNASDGFIENEDGTISYQDYGIGAVFVPSGLAFFNNPPLSTPIGYYNQLIYTFHVIGVSEKDEDEG